MGLRNLNIQPSLGTPLALRARNDIIFKLAGTGRVTSVCISRTMTACGLLQFVSTTAIPRK